MKRVSDAGGGDRDRFNSGGFLDVGSGLGLVCAQASSFGVDHVYGIESDPLLHKYSMDVVTPWVESRIGEEDLEDRTFLLSKGDVRMHTRFGHLSFLPPTLSSIYAMDRLFGSQEVRSTLDIVHDMRASTFASTFSPELLSAFSDAQDLTWTHARWVKRSFTCMERISITVINPVDCYIYKVEKCDRCFDPLEGFGVGMVFDN